MAVSSSSVGKAWPSNWFVAIDWLLNVFRSLLPATFLKVFSTCGEVASTGRAENQLDENGNPFPVEETSSKSEEATPDAVRSRNVSRFLEDQLPQKSANSADGKAVKYRKEVGGKEVARRGAKTPGKASAQNKSKTLKSKKNESSAKATKILEQGLRDELLNLGTDCEVKNPKQDLSSRVKNTEEECCGERDEEQVISLSEPDATEDEFSDKFNDLEKLLISDDASGQKDLVAINGDFVAELNQEIAEDRVSSVRSHSRRKRRRGKQKKLPNCNPDSSSMGLRISSTTMRAIDAVHDSCSVLPSRVSPTNSVNSVSFGCHPPANAREKPSARVPPSRSTVVDRALNSGDVGFVLGDKISSDLDDEKALNDFSILENQMIGEVEFFDSECQELVKAPPFVKVEADSDNPLRVDGKLRPSLEITQPLKNGLADGSSAEVVREFLPETQPCVAVQTGVSLCPLSPSRKQSALISQVSQQVKVKPQSTVNPFSVVNQSHHPTLQTRIKVEPTLDPKPKVTQPPRFRPRSLVNPLRLDQSPQTRVRPHPKVDPVSSSTDLAIPTPNNLMVVKTTLVSQPNLAFRILRRRQSGTLKEISPSPAKHFDSSRMDVHFSVASMEQCSSSFHSNSCHSDSSPSVTKTTVCGIQSNELTTTTKIRSVARKHQNSHLSNRKFLDHASIHDSIRSSTPSGSSDGKSWAVERECGFRDGSSTCDRLPNKQTTSPKNCGPRTNLCSSQVAPDPLTFDFSRAQRYLHTEFLKTVELKRRGGDVTVLKL